MVTEADWQNWTEADLKPYIDTVVEAFTPRRLMFGSDWPVCLVAAKYAKAGLNDQIVTELAAMPALPSVGGEDD